MRLLNSEAVVVISRRVLSMVVQELLRLRSLIDLDLFQRLFRLS